MQLKDYYPEFENLPLPGGGGRRHLPPIIKAALGTPPEHRWVLLSDKEISFLEKLVEEHR